MFLTQAPLVASPGDPATSLRAADVVEHAAAVAMASGAASRRARQGGGSLMQFYKKVMPFSCGILNKNLRLGYGREPSFYFGIFSSTAWNGP